VKRAPGKVSETAITETHEAPATAGAQAGGRLSGTVSCVAPGSFMASLVSCRATAMISSAAAGRAAAGMVMERPEVGASSAPASV
jgi:hypothetical protein